MSGISCDLGVAARVIKKSSILLVKEARGKYRNYWSLPKGRVDQGETAEAAVLRELHEETGVKGNIIGLASVRSTLHSEMPAVFLCYDVEIESSVENIVTDEISESKWFKLTELKNLDWVSDTMHNLAIEALSGKRMALHSSQPLSKLNDSYFVYSVNRHSRYSAGA
jgi:ADP-ribose pyrophosphatase YjhB (NUDIX family)